MNGWKRILVVALLPGAFALAQTSKQGGGAAASARATDPNAADQAEKPANPPRPPDLARADRGKAAYQRYCCSCHGEHGDGRGYSAQWLDPRPRDFTRAIFKCRSTPSGTLPVDDDFMHTLDEGLYHTNINRK